MGLSIVCTLTVMEAQCQSKMQESRTHRRLKIRTFVKFFKAQGCRRKHQLPCLGFLTRQAPLFSAPSVLTPLFIYCMKTCLLMYPFFSSYDLKNLKDIHLCFSGAWCEQGLHECMLSGSELFPVKMWLRAVGLPTPRGLVLPVARTRVNLVMAY